MSSSTGTGCGFKVSFTKRHSSTAFLIFSAHFVQTLDEYSGVFMTESPRSWDIQCKLVQGLFSTPFHEGILNKFSVEMCCIVFPFCTLKEHPQSRQPSPAAHNSFSV